jgi:hypothetical protein
MAPAPPWRIRVGLKSGSDDIGVYRLCLVVYRLVEGGGRCETVRMRTDYLDCGVVSGKSTSNAGPAAQKHAKPAIFGIRSQFRDDPSIALILVLTYSNVQEIRKT